jgi:hypothetical protein
MPAGKWQGFGLFSRNNLGIAEQILLNKYEQNTAPYKHI